MKIGEKVPENIEAVDNLIGALANQIKALIENEGAQEHEVAEKTVALAVLVTARAKLY